MLEWGVIARSLSQLTARGTESALRGSAGLVPGRAMKVGADDLARGSVWRPWPSADRPLCKDAASSLEEALKSTLAAWSHCTRRPLIEVSGGLDSAIVAAGMALAADRKSDV